MLHLSIPSMNEADYLPQTLQCIEAQQGLDTGMAVQVWVCVNQPESYHDDPDKSGICQSNASTLEFLNRWTAVSKFPAHIIDRSSPGKGWTGKDHGVGMARKVLMDAINEVAASGDIIVSMDADSRYGDTYLASVEAIFKAHPDAVALSNPYYHQLTGNDTLDRAMLRYEIYMRYYAINMWRIKSPYSFTALGSAIALPVWAYRKIGGITAKKSGEDFYLLQKLCKTGRIMTHNTELVHPATRYSDRVFFGTGPALIKGSQGLWESYPIYDCKLFDQVKATYELFPQLYADDMATPMDDFLKGTFKTNDIFGPLRKNASSLQQFIKACHHKIDGLRVLQFLKSSQAEIPYHDEDNLRRFMDHFYPREYADNILWQAPEWKSLDFGLSSIVFLDKLRNFLMQLEEQFHVEEFRS